MSKEFGERLKVLRKRKGLTQLELAAWAGVSQAAENKWEHGLSEPSITLLTKLATFFGVSLDTLCGFSLEECQAPESNMAVMTRAFRNLTDDEQGKLIAVGRTLFTSAFDPTEKP